MTRERFEALAEAYGGVIARWPHASSAIRISLVSMEMVAASSLRPSRSLRM